MPQNIILFTHLLCQRAGGPGTVVEAACLECRKSRVHPTLWLSGFKETDISSSLTRKDTIYYGESPSKR